MAIRKWLVWAGTVFFVVALLYLVLALVPHGEFVLFVFFGVGHDDNGSGSGGCWRVGDLAVAAPGGG